jgi:hypothetical protein
MTEKELRCLQRALNFVNTKNDIDIDLATARKWLPMGLSLRQQITLGIEKVYTDTQNAAMSLAMMYELTLEDYDELSKEFEGDRFFQFNKKNMSKTT